MLLFYCTFLVLLLVKRWFSLLLAIYVYMYVQSQDIAASVSACMCLCMYSAYVHVCLCMHIHTYIHTYINTSIHIFSGFFLVCCVLACLFLYSFCLLFLFAQCVCRLSVSFLYHIIYLKVFLVTAFTAFNKNHQQKGLIFRQWKCNLGRIKRNEQTSKTKLWVFTKPDGVQ
jgi:hypothetical protein